MRTMPSDTLVTVPSLRASAASLHLLDAGLDQFADFGRVERRGWPSVFPGVPASPPALP